MQPDAISEIMATHSKGGGELVEQRVVRRREHGTRVVARNDVACERLLGERIPIRRNGHSEDPQTALSDTTASGESDPFASLRMTCVHNGLGGKRSFRFAQDDGRSQLPPRKAILSLR